MMGREDKRPFRNEDDDIPSPKPKQNSRRSFIELVNDMI